MANGFELTPEQKQHMNEDIGAIFMSTVLERMSAQDARTAMRELLITSANAPDEFGDDERLLLALLNDFVATVTESARPAVYLN